MKIGLISDTHGDVFSGEKAIKAMDDVDLILHAGDTYSDAKLLQKITGIDVVAVKGNTDFDCEADSETILTIEDKKIFLTHGHKYSVKSGIDRLYYRALETNSDIVVFGHSHIPIYVEENGIVFINPGSTSIPRGGSNPSYGIIDISKKDIEIKLYSL
jgi:putative phosphoesterase